MTKPISIFRPTTLATIALFFAGTQSEFAASAKVLAPVVELKGSASAGRGSLHTGGTLAEGNAVKTGGDSRLLFTPVPGLAVTAAASTSMSVVGLTVTKNGETVQSRNVVLLLEEGTLSFSADKRKTGKTSFTIQTPHGTVRVDESVGSVTVTKSGVKVASLSGKITYMAPGLRAPITIQAGSLLTASGEGANAQINVVDGIARTYTNFSAEGAQLDTRAATGPEMEATRGTFASALAHVTSAVGFGLQSAASMADVTTTLTQLNQSFADAGLPPVEASSVGAAPRTASAQVEAASAPTGFSGGGSSNPANISGAIVSPEQ
jgi:hypothetical protein